MIQIINRRRLEDIQDTASDLWEKLEDINWKKPWERKSQGVLAALKNPWLFTASALGAVLVGIFFFKRNQGEWDGSDGYEGGRVYRDSSFEERQGTGEMQSSDQSAHS